MQTALEFSSAPFWFNKNLTIDSSSGLIFALFLELPYIAGYISLLLGKVFIDVNICALYLSSLSEQINFMFSVLLLLPAPP